MLRASASLCIYPLLRRRPFIASFASSLSTKREDQWQIKFDELKLFLTKNNGTLDGILEADPDLEKWIRQQRCNFSHDRIKQRPISDRLQKLESLVPLDLYEDKWKSKYEKLKEFKREHGHTNVPRSHELFYWMGRQRQLQKGIVGGGLQDDREAKLRALGFVFDVHKAAWMENYDKLIKFKNYHGHCDFRTLHSSDPSLSVWVHQQRHHYHRRMKGIEDGNGITEERIELLESIGFFWDAREATWERMFEELKEYVRINGHGSSPVASTKSLASWMASQRKLYRKMQDGQKVTLTTLRLQKLRSLGFCL